MSNALQDFQGAGDVGITPDDSPAISEMLQEAPPHTEAAPHPQGLQLKTTGGDTLIEQIELFLRAQWLFRYNIVSNKAEFKLVKNPDAPFTEMRDFDYNSILWDLKYADLQCSMSTLRIILASKFMPEYDPYIEYMSTLPEWDGQTDYIERLANTVTTGNPDFWQQAFKKWFVAMTASWMQTEVVNHTALILSGAQGVGKTTWLGNLIPKIALVKYYIYQQSYFCLIKLIASFEIHDIPDITSGNNLNVSIHLSNNPVFCIFAKKISHSFCLKESNCNSWYFEKSRVNDLCPQREATL